MKTTFLDNLDASYSLAEISWLHTDSEILIKFVGWHFLKVFYGSYGHFYCIIIVHSQLEPSYMRLCNVFLIVIMIANVILGLTLLKLIKSSL